MDRYPLAWPSGWKRTQRGSQKFGRFRTYSSKITVSGGVTRILYELGRLGVQTGNAIISTNVKTRLDGLPYSDQREPEDPGAAVYWKGPKDKTHKVMAVDIYTKVADNLSAIAATLEAMRAIERHGGAQILERAFTGFDTLPAPNDINWRSVLGVDSGASFDQVRGAYRQLAAKAHPDKGGSQAEMSMINRAWAEAQKEIG